MKIDYKPHPSEIKSWFSCRLYSNLLIYVLYIGLETSILAMVKSKL